jgi:hypothetical protein
MTAAPPVLESARASAEGAATRERARLPSHSAPLGGLIGPSLPREHQVTTGVELER